MRLPPEWRLTTLAAAASLEPLSTQDAAPELTFKALRADGGLQPLPDRAGRYARAQPGDTVLTRQGHVAGWAFKKVAIVPPSLRRLNVASTMQVVRPLSGILPDWLYLWLSGEQTYQWVHEALGGRASLTAEVLRAVPVPVAPLDEQRRIVEILREHLSSLDRASRDARRAQERVDAWLQSLLRSVLSRGTEASFTDVFRVLPLPASSVEVRGATSEGHWPVVDQGEGAVVLRTDLEAAVFRGPLPVVVFGDHTRRIKLVRYEFAVGGSGVKLLAPNADLNPEFAYWAARAVSLPSRGYGRHFALLRSARFRTGGRVFQDEVVRRMDEAEAVVEASSRTFQQVEERHSALRRALLEAAFSGQLTGQAFNLGRAEKSIAS